VTDETAPEPATAEVPDVDGPAGDTTGPEAAQPARPAAQHRSFLRELPVLVVIAFVLALLIKQFLVQAFYIPSGSMENTLRVGDRVLVNKVPYLYREPERGEIVVFDGLDNFDEGVRFEPPGNPVAKALRSVTSAVGFGPPSEKDYIKRVIGISGDKVMCCDAQGRVVVTPAGGRGTPLDEPYLYDNDESGTRYFCKAVTEGKPASATTCPPGAEGIEVPEGRLWVMGDHRANSSDSRFHVGDQHQGTVPTDKVVGRAFAVVFPFGHARWLGLPGTYGSFALQAAPSALGLVGALPLVVWRRRRRG
jgi:signal peptidase I